MNGFLIIALTLLGLLLPLGLINLFFWLEDKIKNK
jgi:hypothetical protein